MDGQRAWAAAWRQMVASAPERHYLTGTVVSRGLSASFAYQLLAPHLVTLERLDGRIEFGRVRRWAEDLTIGWGPERPPWPHVVVEPAQLAPLRRLVLETAAHLSDRARVEAFLELLAGERNVTGWAGWAGLVLSLFDVPPAAPPATLRGKEMQAALADLRQAVDEATPAVAAMALGRLGWPLPWTPGPER